MYAIKHVRLASETGYLIYSGSDNSDRFTSFTNTLAPFTQAHLIVVKLKFIPIKFIPVWQRPKTITQHLFCYGRIDLGSQ